MRRIGLMAAATAAAAMAVVPAHAPVAAVEHWRDRAERELAEARLALAAARERDSRRAEKKQKSAEAKRQRKNAKRVADAERRSAFRGNV